MILELQRGPFERACQEKELRLPIQLSEHRALPRSLPLNVSRARASERASTHTTGRGICWVSRCDLCKMCSLCPLIQLSKDLLQQLLFSLFPSHFSRSRSLSLNFSLSLFHWFSLVCQSCCFLFIFHQQVFFSSFLPQMTGLVTR